MKIICEKDTAVCLECYSDDCTLAFDENGLIVTVPLPPANEGEEPPLPWGVLYTNLNQNNAVIYENVPELVGWKAKAFLYDGAWKPNPDHVVSEPPEEVKQALALRRGVAPAPDQSQ